MTDSNEHTPNRRRFLSASLLAGAAGVAMPRTSALASEKTAAKTPIGPPSSRLMMAEAQSPAPARGADAIPDQHVQNPGSDFMVDVLKKLEIDFVAATPGSSFRGLEESIVNYGGNHAPEVIICTHEEVSAALCHGYAKVAGKPMACLVHSNVGLQHASMALYNAWCDRAPMMVLIGNILDATQRRPGTEWYHTAQDVVAMVRDFVKWDDAPVSLQHWAESTVRAYSLALTPPMEPVAIVVDGDLQESPVEDRSRLTIPAVTRTTPPSGDTKAVAEAARLLASAAHPLIVAERSARTAEGVSLLVRLAELLNAPVIDKFGRMNFPTNHYLYQTFFEPQLVAEADVILALEMSDLFGLINAVPDLAGKPVHRAAKADAKVISISSGYGYLKSNEQDFQRYFAADLTMDADAEATLPALIQAIDAMLTPERRQAIAGRTAPLKERFNAMRLAAVREAARGWDDSPISTARLSMELWNHIRTEKWALVSSGNFIGRWPLRLWDFTEYHQYIGGEGGGGVGYGAPSAVGAALAHARAGRLPVAVNGDGDLMMQPGILWTLAHHRIPLLMLVHNNRAWHQEMMHLQRMADRRDRDPVRAPTGTVIRDPDIDYATMARSMGVWSAGPIEDPTKLGAAIAEALKIVKSGKPALIDVITQPR